MQRYWHRQRKDGLFLLNASPCSLSPSPTTRQMSRILAGRNADGYYRSGLIWALERSCSLCVSLLIMIRVRVAETLQRCWPHPLPWADVLACSSCELFSKVISLFYLFLIILTSSPLHLFFFFSFFFPFSLCLLLSNLVSLLTGKVTNLADFVPQVIIFSQCLVEQIVSLALSAITTAVFAWLAIPLTRVTRIPNKAVLILSCAI